MTCTQVVTRLCILVCFIEQCQCSVIDLPVRFIFFSGRGAKRGNRGNRGTTRGGRGNRGMSHTRGRGHNVGQHYTKVEHDNYSPCNDSYGNNSYGNVLSHNSAYNASFENPDYGRNYQARLVLVKF